MEIKMAKQMKVTSKTENAVFSDVPISALSNTAFAVRRTAKSTDHLS
jgi:hypothetical protein